MNNPYFRPDVRVSLTHAVGHVVHYACKVRSISAGSRAISWRLEYGTVREWESNLSVVDNAGKVHYVPPEAAFSTPRAAVQYRLNKILLGVPTPGVFTPDAEDADLLRALLLTCTEAADDDGLEVVE